MTNQIDLYQQVILEHNRKPRNFRVLEDSTHTAEGLNPLCGDHLNVYLSVVDGIIEDISFEGSGCAISKASASMMTQSLKGQSCDQAEVLFREFVSMLRGDLDPSTEEHHLGKLKIFSGIWKYPSRVKCAALAWHATHGALNEEQTVSTEKEGETNGR